MSTARNLGASVLAKLRKSLGQQVTVFKRSPLEVIVLNLLAQHATQRQARQALDVLLTTAVDWNEIRISRLCELTPRLADLNIAGLDRKLTRIQRFLGDVFDRYHRLSLDDLHHLKQAEVKQVMSDLGDIGPQGQEAVYQYALSYQAIALWPVLRRAALHFKLIKADDTDRAATRALQSAVDKDDVNELCLLLTEYGEMHLPPEPRRRRVHSRRAKTSKPGDSAGGPSPKGRTQSAAARVKPREDAGPKLRSSHASPPGAISSRPGARRGGGISPTRGPASVASAAKPPAAKPTGEKASAKGRSASAVKASPSKREAPAKKKAHEKNAAAPAATRASKPKIAAAPSRAAKKSPPASGKSKTTKPAARKKPPAPRRVRRGAPEKTHVGAARAARSRPRGIRPDGAR